MYYSGFQNVSETTATILAFPVTILGGAVIFLAAMTGNVEIFEGLDSVHTTTRLTISRASSYYREPHAILLSTLRPGENAVISHSEALFQSSKAQKPSAG